MNNKRGITLIALIITIIVMLILAGVSVSIVINGSFFDKAERANKLNENAINKAEQDEENALKQNYEEFNVNDNYTISGIEMYEYTTQTKKVYDDSGNLHEIPGVNVLRKIDISLSQYIEENSGSSIYFKAKTNRTALNYEINNGLEFSYQTETSTTIKDEETGLDYEKTTVVPSGENTILIRVDGITKADLNGLKVAINNSTGTSELYSLNFEYNDKASDENEAVTLYCQTNGETDIYNKEQYDKIQGAEISDMTSIDASAEMDDGTIRMYGEVKKEYSNELSIQAEPYSSYKDETSGQLKLYSVQNLKDTSTNSETIYLVDYKLVFFDAVDNVEILTKYLPYVFVGNKEIKYLAKSSSGIEADLNGEYILKIVNNVEINGHKFFVNDDKYINSNIETSDLSEREDILKVEVEVTDIAGNKKSGSGPITLSYNNFEVLADDDSNTSDENRFKATLDEAYDYACKLGKNATINQLISEYIHDDDFEIGTDLPTKNLTYDLNGHTLTFSDYKKMTIANGVTFNLISSGDNDNNGNINFNHPNTFINEPVIKYISEQDFLSRPEYAKFESVGTYIEAGEFGENVKNNFWNRLKYTGTFTSRKINAYLEYIHSFNMVGWNVNFKQQFSGIINYGTINFKSGKIVVNTEERIMAAGAFGGGVVLNIADVFMKTLNALGVEVASITDVTASYAQIENTGVGIENYGSVILGDSSQSGIIDITDGFEPGEEYPEIEINVQSTEHAYGVSVGNFQNPNRVLSRAYGVWNKIDDSTTNMYSGFISNSLLNKTNSWWSTVSIGKTYGIFNEKGLANIYGITKKEITREFSIYGLITEKINLFEELWDEIGLKDYNGFFTYSQLQLVSKLTGAEYYTNSYAIAYDKDGNNSSNCFINEDIKNNINYQDNTYQVVQNFLNYYLNWNTVFGTAGSTIINSINNVMRTGWIGEDFVEVDIITDALERIMRLFR